MPVLPARPRRVLRRLIRAPFFTAMAVLTLGLGIGANAAIFSVVNGVLLKPLPFPDADRLVAVRHTAPGINIPQLPQGPATYFTYRDENRTFEDIGLWTPTSMSVTGTGEPERVRGMTVTDGLLPILGVEAQLGRRFTPEDDAPGSPDRVMVSHAFWQRKYGGRPDVIGQLLTVDGTPHEIVGVLPPGFTFMDHVPQLLLPFRFNRAQVFVGNFSYRGVARLKPGVSAEQASADVARMIPLVSERFPLPPNFTREMLEDVRLGPDIVPLSAEVIGDVGRVLWILLGTVGMVLLIACANVANLFLVRAEGRQQEMAIHAALGASPRRIASELLSESVTLGVLGGIVGVGLAYAGIRTLLAVAPEGLPRLQEITIDGTVLLFTAGISLGAGVLFGLLPVFRFARPQVAGALKEGGRLSSDGRSRHRARNTLVVVEVALALVLLIAAGLMIRTFQALQNVDPGFVRPADVFTLRLSIPDSLVPDPDHVARMFELIANRLEQLPGVTSVALSSSITMDGNNSSDPVFVEDFPEASERIPPIRRFKWVGGAYFETLGNRLIAGRTLEWRDSLAQLPVAVVSENLAREYWKEPHAAVGRRIRENPGSPWREIVGVVADARDDGLAHPAPAIVYWPFRMNHYWENERMVMRHMAFAIRSERAGSPSLLREVQQAVWAVNPNLPVSSPRTLDQIQSQSMAQTSFALVMLGIAGGVALVLGIVGIYGVISYIAAQRTREIGIRVALGAAPGDVSRLFLRHGLVLAGLGIAIGVASAAAVTRVMSGLLFGVGSVDPLTYVVVAVGLGGTALLASYVPAARAARIDPAEALRREL